MSAVGTSNTVPGTVIDSRPRPSIHQWRKAIFSARGPKGGVARCIAATLAEFMDGTSLETFVGLTRLEKASGFRERTVRGGLRTLRVGGWIIERTKGRGHPVVRTAMIPPEATFNGTVNAACTPAPGAALPRHDLPEVTPVNDAGNSGKSRPGTPAPRAAYLDQSLDKSLSAASPSPAKADSAAPEQMTDKDLRSAVRTMRTMRWDDERILLRYTKHGMTVQHLKLVEDGQ